VLVRDDEELPGVEEDRVDLHNEGQGPVRDISVARDSQAITEDDAGMVDQKLIRASLSVIYYHVHCIVEEVPDREAHEDVTGVGKLADEVILHLRSLIKTDGSPNSGDERMQE